MYHQYKTILQKYWHKEVLTQVDILILNEKMMIGLILDNSDNNIIIVQYNKIQHLINCLQIEKFACSAGYDIVIFLAQ